MALRFSANLHFLFPEYPFLDRFAAAARAGFRAVEFPNPYDHSPDELAARLRAHDLACVLLNLPMGDAARGDKGIACLPDRVDEFRAGLARALPLAARLGCPRLNCMAGRAPAGADPGVLRATLVDNLRFAARAFRAAGLTVCLEALSTTEVPGFFLSGSADALALIAEVDEPNLRFQLDCYHLHLMNEDVPSVVARTLPLVGHVQIADAPGRHEPGSGVIAFAPIFAALERGGYDGWIGAEYHPSRATDQTFGWMSA